MTSIAAGSMKMSEICKASGFSLKPGLAPLRIYSIESKAESCLGD